MEYLNSQAVGAAYGLDSTTRDAAIGSNTTAIVSHDSMPTPMMTQTPTNATARAISAKWVEKHSTRGSVYHHRGSVCEHSGSSDDSDYDDNYSEEDSSSSSDSSSDSGDSDSAYSESDNGQARHASVKLTQSKHRATAVDSPVRRQQRQQQQHQQQNSVSAMSDIETGVTTTTNNTTNSSAGHAAAHARVRHSSDGSDDNV
jgi:hypothetical protein